MNGGGRGDGLLRPHQVAELREALCADLAHHVDWPDLWNLHGLLEAWVGHWDAAADSFSRAIERHSGYGTARWNLRWASVHTGRPGPGGGPPPGARSSESIQPEELLGVVRNLRAGVDAPRPAADAGPVRRFFELAAAAGRGSEDADAAWSAFHASVDIASELLATAGFAHPDGTLHLPRLAGAADASRVNPDFSELFRRAGRAEDQRGADAEARRLFALAALWSGNPAAYHVDLGEMANRRGDGPEAVRLFERACRESPEWESPHRALGFEHSLAGDPARALPCLERACALRPRWPDLLYQLGLVQHALGRNDDALRTFERAVGISPGYLVARIALANLLFEARREEEAVPHYERILEEGMATPTTVGRFGYALHAAGVRVRAEEIFLEALVRDPGRPEILALYGLFLAETDRKFEARAVWDRAIESDPSPETRDRIEEMRIDISVED